MQVMTWGHFCRFSTLIYLEGIHLNQLIMSKHKIFFDNYLFIASFIQTYGVFQRQLLLILQNSINSIQHHSSEQAQVLISLQMTDKLCSM